MIPAMITDFRYVTLDGSRKQIVQYQVEFKLPNDKTVTVWKRVQVRLRSRFG